MMADEIGPDGGGSLRKDRGPWGKKPEKPYLRAMVRDPQTVFLYWDFDRDKAQVTGKSEEARWVVKVENLSTGESHTRQIEPDSQKYYAEVSPGCTHRFSIGTLEKGTFCPVCSSKDVEVPANDISGDISARKAETLFATGDASSPHSGDFAASSGFTRRTSKSFWPSSGRKRED